VNATLWQMCCKDETVLVVAALNLSVMIPKSGLMSQSDFRYDNI
jgi:hypothetical protein